MRCADACLSSTHAGVSSFWTGFAAGHGHQKHLLLTEAHLLVLMTAHLLVLVGAHLLLWRQRELLLLSMPSLGEHLLGQKAEVLQLSLPAAWRMQ